MKMKALLIASMLGAVAIPHIAYASPASDALGTCLVDSLTGKERKELATWMFFGMAAHPEIKKYANVTSEDRANSDKDVANLLSRLLIKDCMQQAKDAVRADGQVALTSAFEMVGKVAMRELATNKDVSTALTSYGNYLDKRVFSDVFNAK